MRTAPRRPALHVPRGAADETGRHVVRGRLRGPVESAWAHTPQARLAHDITERKRQEAQTRALASTDELTGLHKRRGFTALAEQQIKLARRSHTPSCGAFVDLDGMKAINDRFGHAVGDDALTDTAAMLHTSFRDADVLARIGGDEFVVLAVGANEKTMLRLQERLLAAVVAANQQTQRTYALSLSLGVVAWDIKSDATPWTR